MESLINAPVVAEGWVSWWQILALVALIALIIFYFQLRKRQQ